MNMVLIFDYTDKNGHHSHEFVQVLNLVFKVPESQLSYVRAFDFDRGSCVLSASTASRMRERSRSCSLTRSTPFLPDDKFPTIVQVDSLRTALTWHEDYPNLTQVYRYNRKTGRAPWSPRCQCGDTDDFGVF